MRLKLGRLGGPGKGNIFENFSNNVLTDFCVYDIMNESKGAKIWNRDICLSVKIVVPNFI